MSNKSPILGIVLVSHSETLVQGILELLTQMNHDNVSIKIAGGSGNKENPIGTNVDKILFAIQSSLKENPNLKALIIFMDIGSALMATEAALDFLKPEEKEKIWLSEGAIVEGSIIALGSALSDEPIVEICQNISNALKVKEAQLKPYLKHLPFSN